MTEQGSGNEQDQGLGEAAVGDQHAADQLREQQGIEEEKAYGDSSAAVTPDTQQPPQGSGQGFGEQASVDQEDGQQDGQEDGQQGNVDGETSYGHDQDAEPPQQ